MAPKAKAVPPRRKVYFNDSTGNTSKSYTRNVVTTARYSIVTFLPLNLWEQFHRIANIYFLLIAALQQIPNVSPLGAGTTAMTLAVVLTATAVKDGWEDYKRHRSDKALNSRLVSVLRDGQVTAVPSSDVLVGDVMRIEDQQFFVADMVLLSTSEPASIAYIETKNLDGETNLKERVAMKETRAMMENVTALAALRGFVECEGPNNRLSSFDGSLSLSAGGAVGAGAGAGAGASVSASANEPIPIDPKNVLLTGCQLKYTRWAYGLVVYTGAQSKLQMQTAGERPVTKRSDVERKTNTLIILIGLAQVVLVAISAIGTGVWLSANKDDAVYLALGSQAPVTQGLLGILTFIILYSNLIPISLYVSMETVKVAQAELINSDLSMYYAADDIPAKARTSSLNEELGQIEYIFSDKTGTLTCNNLVFVKCSVGGVAYGAETDDFPRHDAASSPVYASLDTQRTSIVPSGALDSRAHADQLDLSIAAQVGLQTQAQTQPLAAQPSLPLAQPSAQRAAGQTHHAHARAPKSAPTASPSVAPGDEEVFYEYEYSGSEQIETTAAVRRAPPAGAPRSNAPYGEVHREPIDPNGMYSYTYGEYTYTYSDDEVGTLGTSIPMGSSTGAAPVTAAKPAATATAVAPTSRSRTTPATTTKGAAVTPSAAPGGSAFASGHTVSNVQFADSASRMGTALGAGGMDAKALEAFFLSMSLNHTVIPRAEPSAAIGVAYQAGSPDEGALVNTAAYFGYVFHSRTPDTYTVSVHGVDRTYEMLAFCFFDNDRKRMSVVCRDPEGRIWAYVKGADTFMLPYLDTNAPDYAAKRRATDQHLSLFALKGLRTLVFAGKELSASEYATFATAYQAANAMPSGPRESPQFKAKKAAIDRAYFLLEAEHKDLQLLGASAIEDRLQDGVPDTIAQLRRAGIKIWVLTGDKQDTAIQIGYSCNLLDQGKPIIVLNDTGDSAEVLAATKLPKDATDDAKTAARLASVQRAQERMVVVLKDELAKQDAVIAREPSHEFQCAVDGLTLEALLGDTGAASKTELCKQTTSLLLAITSRCKAVIGCRVSPAQKAQVVAMVKHGVTPMPITLAVGDGANDVVMIKEAHVGVGISGREGQQASLAADYAIGQFRYLDPLLLVHGLWCYNRISLLILYSFAKNVALALIPWYFTFSSAYSGTTPIEAWSQSLYNVLFTALPVLMVGVYDQVAARERIAAFPQLYGGGIRKRFFNVPVFVRWMLSAVFYSVVSYFFVVFGALALGVYARDGQTFGIYEQGTVIYTTLFVIVTLRLALETSSWTIVNAAAVALSTAMYFGWLILYSYVGALYSPSMNYYGTGVRVLGTPVFWLTVIIATVIALVPDYVWKYVARMYATTPLDAAREMPLPGAAPAPSQTGHALASRAGTSSIAGTFGFEGPPSSFAHHALHGSPSGRLFANPNQETKK